MRARSSLVTTSPPSPDVMCLPCCRLKHPMAPIVPTVRPPDVARYAWAQSSTTGTRCLSATVMISPISHGLPNRCVTTIAFVRSLSRVGDRVGGDVTRAGIDVGEHRDGALVEDRRQRAHVGDGSGNDLVARLGIEGRHGGMNRRRAGRAGARMARPEYARKLLGQELDHSAFCGSERSALDHLLEKRELLLPKISS